MVTAPPFRKQNQRHCDDPRRFVRIVLCVIAMRAVISVVHIRTLVVAFIAVEHEEVHPKRIQGGDEHARIHGEIGKAGAPKLAFAYGFDDAVLRIKAREQRRGDQ